MIPGRECDGEVVGSLGKVETHACTPREVGSLHPADPLANQLDRLAIDH